MFWSLSDCWILHFPWCSSTQSCIRTFPELTEISLPRFFLRTSAQRQKCRIKKCWMDSGHPALYSALTLHNTFIFITHTHTHTVLAVMHYKVTRYCNHITCFNNLIMRRITVLNSLLTLQLQLLYVVTCAGEALQLPAYQVDRKKKNQTKVRFRLRVFVTVGLFRFLWEKVHRYRSRGWKYGCYFYFYCKNWQRRNGRVETATGTETSALCCKHSLSSL